MFYIKSTVSTSQYCSFTFFSQTGAMMSPIRARHDNPSSDILANEMFHNSPSTPIKMCLIMLWCPAASCASIWPPKKKKQKTNGITSWAACLPAVLRERFRSGRTHINTHMHSRRFGKWRCVYSAVFPPSARRDLPSSTCHIFKQIQVFPLWKPVKCHSVIWGSAGLVLEGVPVTIRQRGRDLAAAFLHKCKAKHQ